jgi:acetate kinase
LEGLMMNTRCGDVDPGLLFYIMFKERFSSEETENILNKKSGVLGIFNDSSDLRDVMRHVSGDAKAKMAFNMYVRRVRSYIGFYSLILKKTNILIFTDSLGCESADLREAICNHMECLGISIDRHENSAYKQGISMISSVKSDVKILVIPADEEKMIARKSYKMIRCGI